MLEKLPHWIKRAEARIDTLRAISEKRWGVSMSVKVEATLEGLKIYGQANFSKKRIRLHKYLLCEFGDAYIDDVVVHEYAHIVVRERHSNGEFSRRPMPHGREFKDVCGWFGISGASTTKLYKNSVWAKEKRTEKKKKQRVFYYFCGCSNFYHELTIRKHNAILRKKVSRYCKSCNMRITFYREKKQDVTKDSGGTV